MSIRKRGDRYQIRPWINGVRHEETLPPGASKGDAKDYIAKLRREAVDSVVGRQSRRTIGELLDDYEDHARKLRGYQRDLRYRIEVLRQFEHKDSRQIADVVKTLKAAALKPASINRYLAVLRKAYNMDKRPHGIEPLGGETRRSETATPAQARALYRAAGQWAHVIRFAVLTGLRKQRVVDFDPAVNLTGDVIEFIVQAPSGKYKTHHVPIHEEAKKIAKRAPFGIGYSNLNRVFCGARVAAGVPWLRFHDLRRVFASALLAQGADLGEVRDLLGHSSIAQTNTYIGTASMPRLRKAVNRVRNY